MLLLVVDEKSVVGTEEDAVSNLNAIGGRNDDVVDESDLFGFVGLWVVHKSGHGIVNPKHAIVVDEEFVHPQDLVLVTSCIRLHGLVGEVDAENTDAVGSCIENVVLFIVGKRHETHFAIGFQVGRCDETSVFVALQTTSPATAPKGVALIHGNGLHQ